MKTTNSAFKIKMKVVDVNHVAYTATLEGETAESKFLMMIEYDVGGDPTTHTVGDIYDLDLILKKKFSSYTAGGRRKNTPKPKPVNVMSTGHCTGSGKKVKGKLLPRASKWGNDRAVCPDCKKEWAVNYNGTFRKHNG